MQQNVDRRIAIQYGLAVVLCFVLVAAAAIFIAPESEADGARMAICHIPLGNPDNAYEMTVPVNAVPVHVANHGDTIGPCRGGLGPGPGPGDGRDGDG